MLLRYSLVLAVALEEDDDWTLGLQRLVDVIDDVDGVNLLARKLNHHLIVAESC